MEYEEVVYDIPADILKQQRKAYPVAVLCRVMGVSRNGYYSYLKRFDKPISARQVALNAAAKDIFSEGGGTSSCKEKFFRRSISGQIIKEKTGVNSCKTQEVQNYD